MAIVKRNTPNCGVGEVQRPVGPCQAALDSNEKADRENARILYDNLKSIGLDKKPGETPIQYSRRCREYYKSRLLGASQRIGKGMVS